MTHTPDHDSAYDAIQCIVPPYMLEQLARNGTDAQRAWAREALAVTARARELRSTRGLRGTARRTREARAELAAASPIRKNRLIHDAGHDTDLPGQLVRKEGDAATGDVDVDRIYDGLGATWDLYFDLFGRNSYDDDGASLIGTAHYDNNFGNAFWDGEQMVFGDGDGLLFVSMTAAVDVMAHELSHAVTEHESDLEYENQSGALNEHLSDVFGSLVKQRLAGDTAATADWLIGEGLLGPTINGVALRSMIAPGTAYDDPVLGTDPQPAHMDDFVVTTSDNGGVHINSGIPNRAFALFAQALGGNAWDQAGRVWYATATDDALDSNARFDRFAALTADHAFALFGHDVAAACVTAWATVGIGVPWNRQVDRTAQHRAAGSSSTPAGVVVTGLKTQNVAFRDDDGHLHELWRDAAAGTGTSDLTALAGARDATGEPRAYVDQGRSTVILPFRANNASVRSLYWSTGAVGQDDLSGTAGSPSAAGNPIGYHHAESDTHHVVYRGGDGHLHELFWVGVAPVNYGGNLTGTIGAPKAAGDPAPYVTPDGTNIVVYRAVDGRILSVYWKDGPSGLDDLSGTAGTPKAASDPVAYYVPQTDTHQVVYRGVDGHVYELYWVGAAPVSGWNVTASAGAPLATGRPATVHWVARNVKSVVYRRSDGHLHEVWWNPGQAPGHGDVTANSAAPPSASDPFMFIDDVAGSGHLVFRSGDSHVHEISWR
ncbi:M4 family metallopeptidase [Nocardioides sp. Root151]|uniref:M4 family metallopeptidase n=1 Tax=Nocardioides sp. Root151 TaxID=1736475 RepID=UPI0009E9B822|nr:M4 family metallopeptidase [Nocardioides sp. Root151]